MPVAVIDETEAQDEHVQYKVKYRALKRKLKFLLYEHECFLEDLRKAQRKLLKVSRDKSFLLDRLLQYEKVEDSSTDSEATASSESDSEVKNSGPIKKKKLLHNLSNSNADISGSSEFSNMKDFPDSISHSNKLLGAARKRPKVMKKSLPKSGTVGSLTANNLFSQLPTSARATPVGHMTREEVERHLDLKQSSKPLFMSLEKPANMLPDDIFSNENSNPDIDFFDVKEEVIEEDLVIDMPS